MPRILFLGDVGVLRDELLPRLSAVGRDEKLVVAEVGLDVSNAIASAIVASQGGVEEVMPTGGRCPHGGCFVLQRTGTACDERTCVAKRLWSRLQAVTRRGDLRCVLFAGCCQVDAAAFEYMSSPTTDVARLCSLLFHRWRSLQRGATVLAAGDSCEATELRDACLEQAKAWRRPMVFQDWLMSACTWAAAESSELFE